MRSGFVTVVTAMVTATLIATVSKLPLPGQTVTFTTGTGSHVVSICSGVTNTKGVVTCPYPPSGTLGSTIATALVTAIGALAGSKVLRL